ncbi:ARM repeat-containing protein [Tuber magnatum]|uniref:U3 small nucleolar RNA-associated protein 10 n=1 Tax=Tuber magnatum TaxID=42249 RepID=A0A317SEN7_9PEZI|nr:ARM repeat-containing protein [Tuber magnatum]
MASNLAVQLSAIAATSTNTLNTQKLRSIHSISLLFPPSVAAAQDTDTIFSIAIEGFRELCRLDKRFLLYERGLFSEHSKNVDRFVLAQASAESLSKSIDGFLQLLCGRMLLQPALRALEWLVRQFRVQDQNTASLILCFFPYHDHPILFKTLLSILRQKDLPREFVFLTPYLKKPSPIPKHVITHSLSHHRDLLTLLCDYTTSAVSAKRDSHQLVSFFSVAITASVSLMCDSISSNKSGRGKNVPTAENILTCTLPLLDQAFSARSSPELETGCHMLTIVLVTKLSLADTVLTAIIKSIVNHWTAGSYKTGLTCVAYIAQSRFRDDVELPDEVISALLKLDMPEFGNKGLSEVFLSMQLRYRVDRLAVALCLGILKRLGETYDIKGLRIVISLLERANMESHQRLLVTKRLVRAAQKVGSVAMSGGNTNEIRELLAETLVKWAGRAREGKIGKVLAQVMADDAIDADDLEMRLQTVIRPLPTAVPGPAEGATEEAPAQAQTLEGILSTIPNNTGEKTILAPKAKVLFQDLLRFFVAAVFSKRQEEFIKLPLFKDLPPNNPLQISFLIECWASHKYPVAIRSSALVVCAKVIQKRTSKSVSIDYQAVLPHILIALADPNRRVRNDAVDLTRVLFEHYKGLQQFVSGDKPPKKKKRKRSSGAAQYWGLGTIYGEGKDSDEVKWLELDQVIKLMEQITTNDLFGCVEDPEYVGNVLAMVIGTSEGIGSSLKGSLKRSIFVFLSSHAANAPGLEIRYRLLSQINKIDLAGDIRTQNLLPTLIDWLSVEDYNERVKQCQTECLDIVAVEKQMVRVVNADEPRILINILTKDVSHSLLSAAADRIKGIWSAIEPDVQIELATELLEIELDVTRDFSGVDVLERLRIPTAAFQQFFDKVRTQLQVSLSHISLGPNKRRRRGSDGMGNEAKTEELEAARRRATVVTDLLYAQGAEKHNSLLKSLFGILADLAGSHFSGMAYLNQVLLDCMSSIVTNIRPSGGPGIDDSVRPDVLVECIRATTAPQVQNRAILLLANLADVVPERVQHSVMPIFTFMGANTLRRDDEYSAFVIEQTIKRIIPPLVKSLQSQEGNQVVGTAELVNTFVASYSHIPSHRRVRLFVALTKTLGAEEFLFAVIAKLGEKYLSTDAEHPTGEEAVVTSACKMIMENFDIDVQLETVKRYLDLVMEVLWHMKHGLSKHLFEVAKGDRSQLAERLLNLLFIVIGNKKLQDYIAKVDDGGDMRSKKFSQALERVLGPLEWGPGSCVYEAASRVLSGLLYGLHIPRFISIVEHLIFNPESNFRGGALKTFRDRLTNIHRIDDASAKAIVGFAPKISTLISAHDPDKLSIDAIVCITSIIKHCQSEMLPIVASIADAVVGHGGLHSSDDSTQAVSLVCLTNLAAKFKVHIIPILPKAVPRSLELLREGLHGGTEHEVLHDYVIAFLEELVKNLPSFMTSWLEKIMKLMYSSAAVMEEEDEVGVRVGFLKTIGQKMQLDAILRVYTATWDQVIEGGETLTTLEVMESSSKGDEKRSKAIKRLFRTTDSLKPLLSLVLLLLDLRRRLLDPNEAVDIEEEKIQELEDRALKVILKFVYRLNHGNFKPMFLRIIEWATEDLSKGSATSVDRCIALWNFLYLLGSDLESIFTSYFGFALGNAVDILANDTIFIAHPPLWKSTLKALRIAFKSDDHEFWQSPSTFGKIAPVLTMQLARAAASAPVVREYVYPALTELVGAIQGSEEHAKVINGKVLEQMKAENAMVRIAAAEALKDIYTQAGEEWLNFLPESVPVIAELMEDEEEGVETAAHLLVVGIEKHLGEGELQAMLT